MAGYLVKLTSHVSPQSLKALSILRKLIFFRRWQVHCKVHRKTFFKVFFYHRSVFCCLYLWPPSLYMSLYSNFSQLSVFSFLTFTIFHSFICRITSSLSILIQKKFYFVVLSRSFFTMEIGVEEITQS